MTEIDASRPRAVYRPGELDKTRRNLGDIDPEEIKDLTRLLGGEIGVEKPFLDDDAVSKAQHPRSRGNKAFAPIAKPKKSGNTPLSPTGSNITGGFLVNKYSRGALAENSLPEVTLEVRNRMDRLMMSNTYQIKANFGFFNFFVFLNKKRPDKVTTYFTAKILGNYIGHMCAFNQAITGLLATVPDTYKQHVHHDSDLKPKFLRLCAAWDFSGVNKQHEVLKNSGASLSTHALVPTIRNLYQMLMPIYFLGAGRCVALIEAVAVDLSKYEEIDKIILMPYIRKAVTEVKYLFDSCIRGMYPLLLRMSSSAFHDYPQFFTAEIAGILKFLRMTKYDLLLPEKKAKNTSSSSPAFSGGEESGEDEDENPDTEEDSDEEDSEEKDRETDALIKTEKEINLIAAGLKLLNRFFPDTGWLKLSSNPDFFPYFQPIFKFSDGFGLLAPENPVQKVLVFLRILGDLFRGCRHIKFVLSDGTVFTSKNDSLTEIMEDWDVYEDVFFSKNYAENLRSLVNQQYTQPGFLHSALGKKVIYRLLRQGKQYYLPHYSITAIGKSDNDLPDKPLFLRVAYLKNIFSALADRVDMAAENRDAVPGVSNPWEPYEFDIASAVSMRLDLLHKVQGNSIMATNGGLIKCLAMVIAAFDWWINDAQSPAYADANAPIYRISPEDGTPAYPPPQRDDQYRLFRKELEKVGF